MFNFKSPEINKNKLNKAKTKAILGLGAAMAISQPVFSQDKDTKQENVTANISPEEYDIKKNHYYYFKANLEEEQKIDTAYARNIMQQSITCDKLNWTLFSLGNSQARRHQEILNIIDKINISSEASELAALNNKYEQLKKTEADLLANIEEVKREIDSLYKGIWPEIKIKLRENNEEEKGYLDKAPEMMQWLEEIRHNIITEIDSNPYLKKLQIEFNCSPEEAKKHQQIRKSNAENINYLFASRFVIDNLAEGGNLLAFYISNTNRIVVPYELNKDNDPYVKNISVNLFKDIAYHEMWHAVTNFNVGLSKMAKFILSELSIIDDADEYIKNPSERYVRLKALERDLKYLHIWENGEEFTKEKYIKMMEAFKNNQLSDNSIEFITTTKGYDSEKAYDFFKIIFNKIADAGENTNKSYFNPNWNYESENNKV